MAIRFHVMEQLEKAEICDDPERLRWYLSFVVVGGGFTGVEAAGEINDLIKAGTRSTATSAATSLSDGRWYTVAITCRK